MRIDMNNIKKELEALVDEDYREFNKKLSPEITRPMLGIRIPQLRNLAKKLINQNSIQDLLENINDNYFEEIVLQGLVIAYSKLSFEEKIPFIKEFLPKIDGWAITDTFIPTLKIKTNELKLAWDFILPYTKSDKEFEVRFAVIMMLDYFLIDDYVDKVIKILDKINHDGYYVKMAVAWCLAEIRLYL